MTAKGLAVATAYGAKLPKFATRRDARKALYAQRDAARAHLREVVAAAALDVDLRDPDALIALERWYFATVKRRGFRALGTTRTRIEGALSLHVAALLVARGARWVIEPFAFGGGGYELGIELHPLYRIAGVEGLFEDLSTASGNKTQRLMARTYREHADRIARAWRR